MKRFLLALTLVLALVVTEMGAHLYLALSSPGPEQPVYLREEWSHIQIYLSDQGWAYHDFHGRYFNIDNGLRRVVRQPTVYTSTLYLFGNSGMFDIDAPDEAMVASQLQALYNAHGYHVRVVNEAMTALTVSGELLRLQHVPLKAGDSVLFVDGAMDITVPSCDNPLSVVVVLCQTMPHPTQYNKTDEYFRAIAQAQAYTVAHRAIFYRRVQPCRGWQGITPFGMPIFVPEADFASGCHLNPIGDMITAQELFRTVTEL